MMKLMLCFYHSQIHGLTRARVTGVVASITPIVSNLGSGLVVAHGLAPAVLPKAQPEAPPIILHSLGGWVVVQTCPD